MLLTVLKLYPQPPKTSFPALETPQYCNPANILASVRIVMKPGTLLLPLYHPNCRPYIKSLQNHRFNPFAFSRILWLLAICFAAVFVFIVTARFVSLLLLSTHPICFNSIVDHNPDYGSNSTPSMIKGGGPVHEQLPIPHPSKGSAIITPTATSQIASYYKTYGNRCNASKAGLQGSTSNHKYFLGALIANRIFEGDMFHMSTYDIKQWIEYMLYAGVEHIYWYDTAHEDHESQEAHLAKYVEMGLLTYHRFHKLFPDSIKHGYHFEQDNAYGHFLENYKAEAKWVAELDADEYPFSTQDQSSCFLQRFLVQEYERKKSAPVSQVLMQCMFFLGNPTGDSENAWLIEKYQRRKTSTEGAPRKKYQRRKTSTEGAPRKKPIFRPDLAVATYVSNPHFISMSEGDTLVADENRLRMNHYWGSRATDFGPDTPELLASLAMDASVKPLVDDLKTLTGLNSPNYTLQAS